MLLTLSSIGASNKVVACTVHEPPQPPPDPVDRGERLVFVKEGFNWFAFLLPPVWMLVNRLWLALAGYLGVAIVLGAGLGALGVSPSWSFLFNLVLNLLVALEADSIERWTLERKGWRLIGTVSGANSRECERRFFERYVDDVAANTERG